MEVVMLVLLDNLLIKVGNDLKSISICTMCGVYILT